MNDMRKWINLLNEDENDDLKLASSFPNTYLSDLKENWYSDQDVTLWFPESLIDDNGNEYNVHEQWYDLLDRVLDNEQLFIAQDFFATYVEDQHKPAWIADMQIRNDEEYFWRIEEGEDDPDE